jgi:hypothetical protein
LQNKSWIVVLIALCFYLEACDPSCVVSIVNKSNADIKVKVVFENKFHELNFNGDTVCLSDTSFSDSGSNAENCIASVFDTIDNSYNFLVPKFQKAVFEGGSPSPDFNQIIIVNETETLTFDDNIYLRKNGNFMFKEYVFTYK